MKLDDEIVEAPRKLSPDILRSLDAIHLPTANSLKTHVSAFVTYDFRLAQAAKTLGLNVHSPRECQTRGR